MNVLVDTSVWSLAFRRASQPTHPYAEELAELVLEGRVVMFGSIRQELLSGVRDAKQFATLRDHLRVEVQTGINGKRADIPSIIMSDTAAQGKIIRQEEQEKRLELQQKQRDRMHRRILKP